MEQDKFVVEGRVEIDLATMTVFVEGEGLAVLLLEHLRVEKPGRSTTGWDPCSSTSSP